MTATNVFLGRTLDLYRVWAHIELTPGSGDPITLTDHSVLESDTLLELSITFTVLVPGGFTDPDYADRAHDRLYVTGGQVDPESRLIVSHSHPQRELIETAWADWHLNKMRAACDHMTPEMLAVREGEPMHGDGGWQYRMLDTVVCPETGYKWGAAWLAKPIPDDVIAGIKEVLRAAA